jgi:nucleoside-diphosphate-sugar epimerase
MATAGADRPVVLITGASGLIGTRIAGSLAREYRVVGLDVKPPDADRCLHAWIEPYLTADAGTSRAVGDGGRRGGPRIASVIHLAAYYDFSGEPSPLYDELTVEGTKRLLRGLRDFHVDQFVFSSSLLAMVPSEDGTPLNESSPTSGEWDYPSSKLEAEHAIHSIHGEIPVVILRIAGVYDEECHSLPISQQIRRIYERQLESHFFPGDMDRGQSFVHLDDLVQCVRLVVDRRAALGSEELFLIGEPEVVSYGELQDRIGELIHGKEWTTIRIPKFVAKAGAYAKDKLASDDEQFIKPWMIDLADQHYPVDITRARTRLGWEPKHRLRNTLPVMVAALKRDPRKWYDTNGLPLEEQVQK